MKHLLCVLCMTILPAAAQANTWQLSVFAKEGYGGGNVSASFTDVDGCKRAGTKIINIGETNKSYTH